LLDFECIHLSSSGHIGRFVNDEALHGIEIGIRGDNFLDAEALGDGEIESLGEEAMLFRSSKAT